MCLLYPLPPPPPPCSLPSSCSVHLRISEQLKLVAGRDGGLQNMEVLGVVMLRIADSNFGCIRITVDNRDDRSLQFQVCVGGHVIVMEFVCLAVMLLLFDCQVECSFRSIAETCVSEAHAFRNTRSCPYTIVINLHVCVHACVCLCVCV